MTFTRGAARLELVVDDHLDVGTEEDAEAELAAVDGEGAALLDLSLAKEVPDHLLIRLMTRGRRPGLRLVVRGLRAHQRRLLAYFGLRVDAAGLVT